jgi:hypothetical protein
VSRVTIPEKLCFWLGIFEDSDAELIEVEAPLGGSAEKVTEAWKQIEEEVRNNVERS